MKSDAWQKVRIENAPIKIIDGDRSSNYPKENELFKEGEYIFLNSHNINNNKLVFKSNNYISKEKYDSISKGKLQKGDIIITTRGSKLGKVALFEDETKKAVINAQMLLFRSENSKLDGNFLYFQLIGSNIQNTFKVFSSGSAQPQLPIKDLKQIELHIPKPELQRKIGSILRKLEDKIDALSLLNEKLDQLALLIFSNNFLLNTSKYSDGNFGKIITELTKKISTDEQNNYKVLSAVNTGQLIPSEDYFSKQVYSKDLSKYKTLEQFDFAYNPARVNIGSIGMLDKPIKGCVSPVYIAFRTKPNWHYFVDLMTKQPHIRKTIEVYCSGSVRQVLRFEDFCRIEIKLPPEKKVLEFNEVYQSILNKINHNKQQIEKLTALRDNILPKLMTGKIEIKN